MFYNTSKKPEKKTREEIEEQQSTETENLNKGRLTVRFVLLRLQLKSQYSLVYKRGDSIKQGTRNGPGGYFRNFWVEKCRWDPGALNLYALIYIHYPRVNCLKTIPFTAAYTYIAHIWQYPPPPPPGRNSHFLGCLGRELIKSTVKTVDWPYIYAKTWWQMCMNHLSCLHFFIYRYIQLLKFVRLAQKIITVLRSFIH